MNKEGTCWEERFGNTCSAIWNPKYFFWWESEWNNFSSITLFQSFVKYPFCDVAYSRVIVLEEGGGISKFADGKQNCKTLFQTIWSSGWVLNELYNKKNTY